MEVARSLERHGWPVEVVTFFMNELTNNQGRIKVYTGEVSNEFDVERGGQQGGPATPLLWNVHLKATIQPRLDKWMEEKKGGAHGKRELRHMCDSAKQLDNKNQETNTQQALVIDLDRGPVDRVDSHANKKEGTEAWNEIAELLEHEMETAYFKRAILGVDLNVTLHSCGSTVGDLVAENPSGRAMANRWLEIMLKFGLVASQIFTNENGKPVKLICLYD